MARVITVNDVLDGHVVLDIECLDRIYLNAYVPILQTSSQGGGVLVRAPGVPVPLAGAWPGGASLLLQRQLGEGIAAPPVVAGPGLVSAPPPPVRPGPDVAGRRGGLD